LHRKTDWPVNQVDIVRGRNHDKGAHANGSSR
jgi:hypothetical protein